MTASAIRPCRPGDIPSIEAVYAWHVRHGLATFEVEPPDAAELQRRRTSVLALGLPYLVAERGGRVVGYAYASLYRARPAYRHTAEDSIYVAADQTGQGVGRALLGALLPLCAEAGYRQMVAVIGDSGNAASIGLHRAMGFRQVGLLPAVGFKFGRWVDSVLMQRPLGPGDSTLP
jgi:phosphinothricin acetyltransferase